MKEINFFKWRYILDSHCIGEIFSKYWKSHTNNNQQYNIHCNAMQCNLLTLSNCESILELDSHSPKAHWVSTERCFVSGANNGVIEVETFCLTLEDVKRWWLQDVWNKNLNQTPHKQGQVREFGIQNQFWTTKEFGLTCPMDLGLPLLYEMGMTQGY